MNSNNEGFLIEACGWFVTSQEWWNKHLPEVIRGSRDILNGRYSLMRLAASGVLLFTLEEREQMRREALKQEGIEAIYREEGEKVLEHFRTRAAAAACKLIEPKEN